MTRNCHTCALFTAKPELAQKPGERTDMLPDAGMFGGDGLSGAVAEFQKREYEREKKLGQCSYLPRFFPTLPELLASAIRDDGAPPWVKEELDEGLVRPLIHPDSYENCPGWQNKEHHDHHHDS